MKKNKKIIILISLFMFIFSSIGTAHAYLPSGAASYADNWVYSFNSNFPKFSSDCTNFVSQAMNVGGAKPQTSTWWVRRSTIAPSGFEYSYSWVNANSLRSYFASSGQGTYITSYIGYNAPNTSANIQVGDIIFYDWTNNGSYDHASIVTSYGTDRTNSSWYGDLISQHSTARYRVIWHLRPYNTSYAHSTKVAIYRPK